MNLKTRAHNESKPNIFVQKNGGNRTQNIFRLFVFFVGFRDMPSISVYFFNGIARNKM